VTDRFLEPPDAVAGPESGQALRLPDSFWLSDPLGETPMVSELPAASSRGVVFGCLSRFSKVNEPVLRLWSELLNSAPGARLLLLCPEGGARSRVLARFAAGGVESSRVEFTGNLSRADYLALYRRIDIALDPFPYNGHMTTFDALWMGVPVVTLAGETQVSRGGLSLLSNAGLPELIAFQPEEYLRIARELAGDLPRLAALRGGLRARLQASPLMDGTFHPRPGGCLSRNVAAVVHLGGGEGKMPGTLTGASTIAVIQNGLKLTTVEGCTQKVVLCLVILGAVLLDKIRHAR
jgi:hypothetical protein